MFSIFTAAAVVVVAVAVVTGLIVLFHVTVSWLIPSLHFTSEFRFFAILWSKK